MKFRHRVLKKIVLKIKSEVKVLFLAEYCRCSSTSQANKRCIKQNHHMLWHEDAWGGWWW